jgi:hypothetical protein
MKWAGHVARVGRGEAYTEFWWGNLRERDYLEDTGLDGRKIFTWLFRKRDVGACTGRLILISFRGGLTPGPLCGWQDYFNKKF